MVQLYCTIPQNMDHAGFYVDGASWGDSAQLSQLSVATLFVNYRWKESEMSTPDVSNLLPLEDDMMVPRPPQFSKCFCKEGESPRTRRPGEQFRSAHWGTLN